MLDQEIQLKNEEEGAVETRHLKQLDIVKEDFRNQLQQLVQKQGVEVKLLEKALSEKERKLVHFGQ